ncbi:MAG: hypothetical protein ACI8T1_000952 [Verrucomicrobiales bacterium]
MKLAELDPVVLRVVGAVHVTNLSMRILSWSCLASVAIVACAIGGETDMDLDGTVESIEEERSLSWRFRTQIDAEGSVLWSDGIILTEYSLGTRLASDYVDIGLTITRNDYDVTYEPEIFGSAADLSEDSLAYALDGRLSLGKRWNLLGSVSYYDGFTDYRSLWISEYYGQLFGGVPEYRGPDPEGTSVTLGLEWEYIPVMGKLRLTGGYGKDTIATAYEFGENGLTSSRPNLYTNFIQFQTENVLSPSVVVQNTVQYTNTTNREKRWSTQTAWNVTLMDGLVLRMHGGFAVEHPAFDAYFFGGTLEYELVDDWFFRINARYYEDTGEIENGLGGFTSSAPSLESTELGVGLRWQGIHSAVNLYAGYYQTEYDPLLEGNAFLKNLYNDRRWGIVQLTYSYTF